jgi:hypothetical protein
VWGDLPLEQDEATDRSRSSSGLILIRMKLGRFLINKLDD